MEKAIHLPKKEVKKFKPNNKLDALSINEELGDIPTHFMKSGSTFRPKEQLKGLNEFKRRLIPKYASNGVEFEYDLWFNTNEINTIRRFLYTDFLGKGIYTRVNSVKINTRLFQSIVDSNIKIDEERIEKIRQNLEDKYTFQWNTEFYDKVIFLPGSNLLCKKGPDSTVIDFGRMKKLIDAGYVIKPHPITAHLWMAVLRKEFGAENVLNKKEGGFELLLNCKEMACAPNSEMGLIALLMGKKLSLVSYPKSRREKSLLTYESFYDTISNRKSYDALCRIFSAKNSGIIFSFDDDAEERLQRFVDNFWNFTLRE